MVICEGKNFVGGRGHGDGQPRGLPGCSINNNNNDSEQQQGAVGGLRARGRGRDANMRNAQKSPTDSGKPISEQRGSPKDRSSPIGGSPDRITKELEAFKKQVELTKRPGYGSIGRHFNMLANHFEIRLCNTMTVSQYYVDITHPRLKLNRDENRKLFWTCISRNRQTFTNPYSLAYDGVRSLFSLNQLQLPNGNSTVQNLLFQ